MARNKTSIVLSEAHKQWLSTREDSAGISDAISGLVEREMGREAEAERQKALGLDKLSQKERFLYWVSESYHTSRAQKLTPATDRDLANWNAEDPKFGWQVVTKQQEFLDELEFLIVDAARGKRHLDRAAMTGLIAFLNNHAKNWGRIKAEFIGRICGPIFDGLLKIVKARVNPTVYREIAEEFAGFRDTKLSEFSE